MAMRFQEYHDGKYRVREFGKYIVAHQGIQLTFKGTRVLVPVVLEALAHPGRTIEQVAADYHLPVEAVAEGLQVAAHFMYGQLRLPDPHPDEMPVTKWSKRRTTAVFR